MCSSNVSFHHHHHHHPDLIPVILRSFILKACYERNVEVLHPLLENHTKLRFHSFIYSFIFCVSLCGLVGYKTSIIHLLMQIHLPLSQCLQTFIHGTRELLSFKFNLQQRAVKSFLDKTPPHVELKHKQ